MTGVEKESKLPIDYYDLGASLALCFCLLCGQASVNVFDRGNSEKPTLLRHEITKIISKLHKKSKLMLNASRCIKIIDNIYQSLKSFKNLRKFMKGF